MLRLSLANRERLSGVVTTVGRYDLSIESEGRVVTLPKKEVFHISPAKQLLEDSFFADAALPEEPAAKSRVQDEFLNRYVKEKTLALIKMTNGDELRGVIEGYDGFTLSVKTGRGQVLLYKHGICSVGPGYRRNTEKQ